MKKNKKYLWRIFVCLILSSCSYDFPVSEQAAKQNLGEINTDKIVVVGDDFLAGLMDGALYNSGQENSVASIIHTQLSLLNDVPFLQAKINSENGFNIYASNESEIFGKWIYKFKNKTNENPQLFLTVGDEVEDYNADKNLLNDITVPNLSVNDLLSADFSQNYFLSRVFQDDNFNLTDQIVQKSPSFVICWLGMNDFLNFAINGATEAAAAELTSVESFQENFQGLIDFLIQKTDSKIVLGNLISFQDLPYFYIRPYNSLFLDGKELSNSVARYAKFNKAVAEYNRSVAQELQRPFIDFLDNGYNLHPQSFVVIDNSLPDATYQDGNKLEKYRKLTPDELILFNVSGKMVEAGFGSTIPLEEKYYLSGQEIETIKNKVDTYNTIIFNSVNNQPDRIAIVDIRSGVSLVAATGKTDAFGDPIDGHIIYFDGVPIEGSLGLNSIFSLDGLHFNQRGNAFVANLFIDAINQNFEANIPKVDINDYIGNNYSY